MSRGAHDVALIGLGSGLWLAWAGHDLGIGDMYEPGSGFILFWVGIILAALSAALAASGAFGSNAASDGAPFGERWQKVPLVLFYLIVYAALLEAVRIPTTERLVQVLRPKDVADAQELLDGLLRDGDLVLVKGSNGSGVWRLAEHLTGSDGDTAW